MKRIIIPTLSSALFSLLFISPSIAQSFDNAGGYMDYIGKAEEEIAKKYISYMSAASHGGRLRKVEKRRNDLVNSIYETRVQVNGMPSYKGDKSLKDASVEYLKILYSVFNEDYSKIVNMEEIAEQSYDNMEAYILVQEKANERLKAAFQTRAEIGKEFAKKNNITLVDQGSALSDKLAIADEVGNYYHQVYLIFFKSFNQEKYLVNAISEKNINAIEQNKNALAKYSEEGLQKLKSLKSYSGDGSIIVTCRQVLEFMKDEATNKVPLITDFILKEENFMQVKKAFDSKSASKRTQKDIDEYNKAVNEMNSGVNKYNATNSSLNNTRSKLINAWNKSVEEFMDTHMPYR